MVIVAVDGKARVDLRHRTGGEFIGVDASAAVVDQQATIARPIGRLNDMIEFSQNSAGAGGHIDGF